MLDRIWVCRPHNLFPHEFEQTDCAPAPVLIRCDGGCLVIAPTRVEARRLWNSTFGKVEVARPAPRDDREAIIPFARGGVVNDETAWRKKQVRPAANENTYETRLIRGEIYDAALKERDQAIRDRVAMEDQARQWRDKYCSEVKNGLEVEDERDTARLDAKAAREALERINEASRLNQENEHAVQDKLRKERDDACAEVERQNAELTAMRLRLSEAEQQRDDARVVTKLLDRTNEYLLAELNKYRDLEVKFEALVTEAAEKRVQDEREKLIEMKIDRDVARATAALEKKRLAAAREAMVNLRGLESDQLPDILESFDQAVASI